MPEQETPTKIEKDNCAGYLRDGPGDIDARFVFSPGGEVIGVLFVQKFDAAQGDDAEHIVNLEMAIAFSEDSAELVQAKSGVEPENVRALIPEELFVLNSLCQNCRLEREGRCPVLDFVLGMGIEMVAEQTQDGQTVEVG